MRRWRCRDKACGRRTFVEQFPEIAAPLARRTRRVTELIHLFGHGVGGRPSERLLKRIGMPTSDDTILRHLKRRTDGQRAETSVRVVGVDDWAWRKGHNYGTIVVDLERREVVDVLPDRSTANISAWLAQRPEIEVVSRDRCGSYAQGAQDGAPQAHQVADRFHMYRICARRFRRNSAALGHRCAPCCLRGTPAAATIPPFHAARATNTAASNIATSSEWLTGVQGRLSLTEFIRCVAKVKRLPRLCDRPASTVERSASGSRATSFPNETLRRRKRVRPSISKTIYRAVGRKVAYAAEGCLTRSRPEATAEASQIWSACWRNGAARNAARGRRPSFRQCDPLIRRTGDPSRRLLPLRSASSHAAC